MAMIRPETEMKDSGIEWIGIIPNNWNIKPLYACLDEINQTNSPVVTTNILSLTNTDGVIPYSERGNQGNKSKENFEEYKVVYPNTIVANSMNILIGSVGLSQYEGCVSPVYYVYAAKPQVDIRYMNYLFQMEPFQKRLRQFANGILEIRLRVSSHDILHQKVAVPDYGEQQAIADYLDKTCSKIDEIIAEAKASIDEYENLRQSIIYEILTKGPDDNVEMKDSGVEWIGKVPSHWMIGKVKYGTTKVGSGKTPKGGAEVYMTSGVMFLRSQNIYNDGLRLDNPYYISEEIDEEMKNTRVQKNDVLLNITGGSIGRCCIFDGSIPNANVNQHVCIIRVNSSVFLPEYMHLFWISPIGQISIKSYQTGGNREGMSAEAIKNTPIPIIPIGEQRRIVDLIKPKIDDFNSLISEKESLINDLEAYKKSLIYEVVTGKRRVV